MGAPISIPVERTSQRLAEGAVQRVEIGGQRERLACREDGILGEAAVAVNACGDVAVRTG